MGGLILIGLENPVRAHGPWLRQDFGALDPEYDWSRRVHQNPVRGCPVDPSRASVPQHVPS
jgi:hypothetical protein